MNKKIRILMDHQIFTMQDYGGISRVFAEMYKRFNNSNSTTCQLPIIFSENVYFDGILKTRSIFRQKKSFIKRLFYYAINHIVTIFVLLKGDYDVFLPSYYDPYFLPFLKGKPFVLVLHDMTHEIFPEIASAKDKTVKWKKTLASKADKIVAISENTKKDIIKFYGIDESKIEIIYWATVLKLPQKTAKLNLPQKYLLFVGDRGKYKNFNRFFKAIIPLLQKDPELYLVCAGSKPFTEDENQIIKISNLIGKVLHVKFRDNNQLAWIYKNALCFVYPSLYEGFGSPILEAFACECPVILSNTSSLPEIGGEAVGTFNPQDEKSIRGSIENVIYNDQLRENMIKKGRERIKTFTYEKTINNYIKVFEEII